MRASVVMLIGKSCVVETDDGFTSLHILGAHRTSIGDTLSGALESLGSEILRNLTTGEEIVAVVKRIDGSNGTSRRFQHHR